jgi:hypothetical protein
MEVRLFKSICEVPKDEWNSIVGADQVISSYDYLLAVENSKINDCDYYYPVVYENGEIIAHTCFYSVSFELDLFAKGLTKKFINLIRRFWKHFLILRFVECGTPVALGHTLSFRKGVHMEKTLEIMINQMK